MASPFPDRTALVLGGGGLKGFAHIGVLRALRERGIVPSLFAGTSIGALIAAAHLSGMSLDEMARQAEELRKRDLFRLNHLGMLLERVRSPSLYLEAPLRALSARATNGRTFDELPAPLLISTVDVERGTRVVWGLPGLRDVPVSHAVYASCALPGFFPPGRVGGRLCIDGGTVDNLPAAVAAVGMDAVIAVDVGSAELGRAADILSQGFASIYMRAATTMMHALQEAPLASWSGPPMLLIRPRLGDRHWFSFSHTSEIIEAGYDAAIAALDQMGDALHTGGIHPRQMITVAVDRGRCTGCGLCAALAPQMMAMDDAGKAVAVGSPAEWSPADGGFVHHCPTDAIHVESDAGRAPSIGRPDAGFDTHEWRVTQMPNWKG